MGLADVQGEGWGGGPDLTVEVCGTLSNTIIIIIRCGASLRLNPQSVEYTAKAP